MDIQITGRNLAVNDVLKEYVNSRLGPVVADHPRVESCHVILAHEKYRHMAEVVVQGRDKLRAEAAETTDDMYASIDAAAEKRGLRFALWGLVGVVVVILAISLPPNAPLRDAESGSLIGVTPFMNSLVFIISLGFLVCGVAYGYGAGTLRASRPRPRARGC